MKSDEEQFAEVMATFEKAREVFVEGQRAFAAGEWAAFEAAVSRHTELTEIHRALVERYKSNPTTQ